ncbi:MAG TPA: peptide ABC transporter substrate-binding protein [Clostridiaceae bacterium]|nr:peptide ABC transporter substrate-binding protein [Clostridiaceae bacterium]
MNRKPYRNIPVIAIILVVMFIMVSCQQLYNSSENINNSPGASRDTQYVLSGNTSKNSDSVLDMGPVKGGVLRIFSTDPDTLNPIITNNKYVKDFSGFIFESLVALDKNQKPVPLLSESWEVSNNGLIWTFHIRDNVYWHDKQKFTAYDVEYTFDYILKNSIYTTYKDNLQNVTTFAAVDEKNFRIVLSKPNSFTAELMTFPILPKHLSDKNSVIMSKEYKPVGTGPFKYLSYKENERILLEANSDWWYSADIEDTSEKLPYIDQIYIELYDNSAYAVGAFQTRDVDVNFNETVDYDKYYGRYDLTIKKYTGNRFEFVSFNLDNPILSDVKVRQAINYAVNKEKIIGKLLPEKAVASDFPIVPGSWLNDSNIVAYEPSITKAKKILEEAGWKEENSIFYKWINWAKRPLKLELLVNEDNDLRKLIAYEIKEQLAEAGFDIQVKEMKWEELIKKVDKKDYDMVIMGCSAPSVPDISFLYSTPYLPDNSSPESLRGRNIAGYSNPMVDKYIERIYSEHDDERKKALFINMRNIIIEDVPYLVLFFYNDAVLLNRNMSGNIQPHAWNKFSNIARWYIPRLYN